MSDLSSHIYHVSHARLALSIVRLGLSIFIPCVRVFYICLSPISHPYTTHTHTPTPTHTLIHLISTYLYYPPLHHPPPTTHHFTTHHSLLTSPPTTLLPHISPCLFYSFLLSYLPLLSTLYSLTSPFYSFSFRFLPLISLFVFFISFVFLSPPGHFTHLPFFIYFYLSFFTHHPPPTPTTHIHIHIHLIHTPS
jgi:hypothetical protein